MESGEGRANQSIENQQRGIPKLGCLIQVFGWRSKRKLTRLAIPKVLHGEPVQLVLAFSLARSQEALVRSIAGLSLPLLPHGRRGRLVRDRRCDGVVHDRDGLLLEGDRDRSGPAKRGAGTRPAVVGCGYDEGA